MFPNTSHCKMTLFLVSKPCLLIHLIGLLFGIMMVDRNKSKMKKATLYLTHAFNVYIKPPTLEYVVLRVGVP